MHEGFSNSDKRCSLAEIGVPVVIVNKIEEDCQVFSLGDFLENMDQVKEAISDASFRAILFRIETLKNRGWQPPPQQWKRKPR